MCNVFNISKKGAYTVFKRFVTLTRVRPLRVIFVAAAVGLMCVFGGWEHLNEISLHDLHSSLSVHRNFINGNASIKGKPSNPHPFVYTSLPDREFLSPNVCLLILVKSSIGHFQHRDDIRNSWGGDQYSHLKGCVVQTVFMLGQSTDATLSPKLRKEINLHGDIVQENFQDSYLNNTYKTIMTFNWAAECCSQAKYFLFVDDDYLVNVYNILNYLVNASENSLFAGYYQANAPPIRKWFDKWYISLEDYPYSVYPPFISGGAFVVSKDLVKLFARAFLFTKPFRFDDVYLGIVAYKLGITLQHDDRFIITQPSDRKEMVNNFAAHYDIDHKKMVSDWSILKIKFLDASYFIV